MPPSAPSSYQRFKWSSAIVGGLAGIGISALLGTVVTNVALHLYLAGGQTVQEAYSQFGFSLSSPAEQLSLAVVLLAGFVGGFISASYGNGRHTLQGFVAGLIGTLFFVAMSLAPAGSQPPLWYIVLTLACTLIASILGGYARGRRHHLGH